MGKGCVGSVGSGKRKEGSFRAACRACQSFLSCLLLPDAPPWNLCPLELFIHLRRCNVSSPNSCGEPSKPYVFWPCFISLIFSLCSLNSPAPTSCLPHMQPVFILTLSPVCSAQPLYPLSLKQVQVSSPYYYTISYSFSCCSVLPN